MVSLSIESSKDSSLKDDYPDTNYGTDNYLDVYVFGISGDIRRAIFEFNLSSFIDVPIENISSATLRIYVANINSPRTLDIRKVDNDTWTETGVTWNNQPSSTDFNIEHTFSSTGWDEVSVLSMVKQALYDGHNYLGILIRDLTEVQDAGTTHSNEFNSKEETNYEPELNIEYNTYSQTALHGNLCKNLLFKDGFGEITMTDHNCPSPCDAATFTFKTAWGATYTTVLLDVGDTQQYDSGVMHHSFKLDSMTTSSAPCDNLAAANIEEKYWEDDCYVKTTGDNDRNGTDWTEAWSTVDQAANEAFDGQEVHIGFGTYSSEPANNDITPVNFGTTGIKYTPETAGTGGGTGTVTVERN